ncbi:ABC transporter permease [candidate division MSBL1 archaeon SCGC-AAA259E19]|uniref:ABC transporter permease n=1 Tax=candidate division MSBL1 archaeon SCGC-AAA259E19 TaxID=1698264 RepID=A0A133UL43_9EURY|nr:ABC transporter permease [candidate division MSBL1 archaeon SCGC-AAA259E19]
MRQERKDQIITWAVFVPILALVAIFVYGFIGWNFLVSLTDWAGLTPSYNIVGFENWTRLFGDPAFYNALENQLLLVGLFVPVTLVLGLFLAILLDRKLKVKGMFRNLYMLPFGLSYVVTAVFWAWMYNPTNGTINELAEMIGLKFLSLNWLGDPEIVMYGIILALIWQFSGYTMVIFLAGIKSLPQSQVDAARVGGASGFTLYRKVVIPQLKGSFLTAFVILMIFALKAFDFIWVLRGSSPSSSVLATRYYVTTFDASQFAYGACFASILFLLVLLIVIPYLYLSQGEE